MTCLTPQAVVFPCHTYIIDVCTSQVWCKKQVAASLHSEQSVQLSQLHLIDAWLCYIAQNINMVEQQHGWTLIYSAAHPTTTTNNV